MSIRKILLFTLTTSIITLALGLFCVKPTTFFDNLSKKEQIYLVKSVGYDAALYTHGKAEALYSRTLIDSGIYRTMQQWFIPTEEERKASKGLENFGLPVFEYLEERLDNFAALLYLFYLKVFIFLQYSRLLLFVLVQIFLSAFVFRRRKNTGDISFSPQIYRCAVIGISVMIILFFGMFIAPVAVAPWVFPTAVIAIGQVTGCFVACWHKQD